MIFCLAYGRKNQVLLKTLKGTLPVRPWSKFLMALINSLLVGGALFFFLKYEKNLSSLMNLVFISVSGLCLLINFSYLLYISTLLIISFKRKTGARNYFNTETIQRQIPLQKTLSAKR